MRFRNLLLLGALGGAAYVYRDTLRRKWEGMTAHSAMYGGKTDSTTSRDSVTTVDTLDTTGTTGTTSGTGGSTYGPGSF
ncbi:MAG TPA: hypothetical protein VNZ52_09295 [Candidatus Thermoplasmatota archaeon]|nr:hypothetical protein [Candidatus Thermoplasmatota archaeon]